MTTLDLFLGAEGSLHKSKTAQQLTYIMLVAGDVISFDDAAQISARHSAGGITVPTGVHRTTYFAATAFECDRGKDRID